MTSEDAPPRHYAVTISGLDAERDEVSTVAEPEAVVPPMDR